MTIERRLVTFSELKQLGVPYTRQHLSRLEKQQPPRFPKRVRLGGWRVVWLWPEVEAWLQDHVRQREPTT